MKKKLALLIAGILVISTLTGCQSIAKNLGGTHSVTLNPGEKLINITWKDNDLWYLTRSMTENDIAETYEFKESSNFGVFEGTIIIKEIK